MSDDDDLARWYVGDLRPKLAGAARRHAISRPQAEAFDRLMLDLLRLRRAAPVDAEQRREAA